LRKATLRSSLRKPLRKLVWKTLSKIPSKTLPSERAACPRKTPPIFEAFPKPCRMPPFEDSAETPAGPPFGECHLSRKPARSHFSESPFRHAFETDPSVFPSEHATCPEGQAESYPVSPSKPPRETFRIYPRNTPRVSECRAKTLPPEATRTCHPFRVPKQ